MVNDWHVFWENWVTYHSRKLISGYRKRGKGCAQSSCSTRDTLKKAENATVGMAKLLIFHNLELAVGNFQCSLGGAQYAKLKTSSSVEFQRSRLNRIKIASRGASVIFASLVRTQLATS